MVELFLLLFPNISPTFYVQPQQRLPLDSPHLLHSWKYKFQSRIFKKLKEFVWVAAARKESRRGGRERVDRGEAWSQDKEGKKESYFTSI